MQLPQPTIHLALSKLLGLPNLSVESLGQVSQALDGYARGLDFADALHLFASMADEGLFTFDQSFASVATAAGHSVHVAGASPTLPG